MSAQHFEFGEVAIVYGSAHGHDHLNGSHCIVLALPRAEAWVTARGRAVQPGWYLIDISGHWFQCLNFQLRKLPPPRDDLEVVRWSDVPGGDVIARPAKVPA